MPASKPVPVVAPIVLVPNPAYYEVIPFEQPAIRYTYRDLSLNAQEELLASVVHEQLESEIERMSREVATEALNNKVSASTAARSPFDIHSMRRSTMCRR